ncbi:MAG TPA: hypothetical protein DCM08_05305, partial [Microscillaceae bacterium]|nr:hypothetical protein [Microscillaceae bacterium]
GSVGLNELRLAAAKQTMFVAEQIEGPSSATRAIPPSEIFNFISTSRHWRIRNLPYVANGDISAADNSNYRLTRVSLWFDAPSEIISGNVANTIFSDLLQLRIVKDSIGTWNAALSNDNNVVNPTYNDATTHENRAKLGTAHPGTLWRNVDTGGGIEDINQNAIQAESDLLGINSPGGFGDGTFALAFNYTALPISFLDLEATLNANKEVQLRWTAGNQNPTEKFILERSFDASLFRTLGEVAAKPFDPNTNLQVYNFTDRQPQNGMNYYKVHQLTSNRQDKSSKIVSVNVENGEVFIIYPNPIEKGGLLSIASSAKPGEEVEVSLVDVSGKIVLQRATRATGEPLVVQLDKNLSDGVYVVRLKTESKTYQAKIVIQ